MDGGRYGEVSVLEPSGPPRGLVVLFSDAGGWKAADTERLRAVAAAGAIAVGVDLDRYLGRLPASADKCLVLFDDADALSRQLQRLATGTDYFAPILAGVGEGATLAGEIVAQGRDGMFAGAISLAPAAAPKTPGPLCPREPEPADVYAPVVPGAPAPRQFWTVALRGDAAPAEREHYADIARRASNVSVREEAAPDAPATLAALIAPWFARSASDRVGQLPLIELRADRPTRRLAIFLSGDAGWREVDSVISRKLRDLGLSVVGWDSLRYFWREKTPDQLASDLSAVIATYRARWDVDEVALVGFSFGADVIPFAYDRLPGAARARVRLVSLLALGTAADWEIRVSGWLGAGPSARATPMAPAMAGVPPALVQCFYGDQDTDASCASFKNSGIEIIEKQGTHHFDHDYERIAEEIVEGLNRRVEAAR